MSELMKTRDTQTRRLHHASTSPVIGKIRVRLADNQEDLDQLRPLSSQFHQNARYAQTPYSFEKRDALFRKALEHPKVSALILAELDGTLVGYISCTVGEYIVGTGDLFTTIHAFYVCDEVRGTLAGGRAATRLARAVIKWSEARGVKEILAHDTTGFELKRTDRFFQKFGFQRIGANYALPLAGSKVR